MKVIYSIGGCKFNGGGIGRTSYHAVAGIHRHGMLKQLIVPAYKPSEIPEELITTVPSRIPGLRHLVGPNWADAVQDMLHARLAAWVMRSEADLFHGWAGMSLEAIIRFRSLNRGGSVTVLDRASPHILKAKEILTHEYHKWGLREPGCVNRAVRRELREYELVDYIFTPSEFARESFLKRGFPEYKVRLIRFGVEQVPDEIFSKSKGKAEKTRGKLNALFVGKVGFLKGVLYALQAWQEARVDKGKFYVVGPIDKEIRPFLRKYEDDESIVFTGFADPSRHYLEADVFLFPSLGEGSALVTYEALSYGLPLITTFNSGSVIVDGQEGFIVAEGSSVDIREALEKLAEDSLLRRRMSKEARATAKKYTWERYGESVVREYEEIKR